MLLTRPRIMAAIAAIASLTLILAAAPAGAKRKGVKPPKPAVTKMKLSLDSHEVALGEDVTGTVTVRTRSGRSWVPLADAAVDVFVGQTPVGNVTTGADGTAAVSFTTDAIGEYAMKVVYAGDATHKKAKHAQGFEVAGTFFRDADGDGFGDPNDSQSATAQPEGYVADGTDCDDASSTVHPGAVEDPTNSVDDNCDGQVDEAA